MFTITEKTKDRLVLLLPVLWLFVIVFVYISKGLYSMYLGTAIAAVSVVLGLSEGEKMNKKLFMNLLVGWLVVMLVSVTGMIYYYEYFGEAAPTFTLLGMHPSGFFLLIGYWLGNYVYLSLTFYRLSEIWLPQERWDNFVNYAKSIQDSKESA